MVADRITVVTRRGNEAEAEGLPVLRGDASRQHTLQLAPTVLAAGLPGTRTQGREPPGRIGP